MFWWAGICGAIRLVWTCVDWKSIERLCRADECIRLVDNWWIELWCGLWLGPDPDKSNQRLTSDLEISILLMPDLTQTGVDGWHFSFKIMMLCRKTIITFVVENSNGIHHTVLLYSHVRQTSAATAEKTCEISNQPNAQSSDSSYVSPEAHTTSNAQTEI